MPSENKLEARPRAPAIFSAWKRQAENSIRVFESVYGLEHGGERRHALAILEASYEADEHAFPLDYLFGLWEELTAAWAEQLREGRRGLQL
eukprot:11834544-Heterocapsa_arctica.AAC.1